MRNSICMAGLLKHLLAVAIMVLAGNDLPAQTLTVLHAFSALNNGTNSDGAHPQAGLTLSGGTLYGSAAAGGVTSNGTLFAVNTDGSNFTVLHHFALGGFTNADGSGPDPGLLLSGGTLYGAAVAGGGGGDGRLFFLNANGTGFSVITPGLRAGSHSLGGFIASPDASTIYGTMSDSGGGQGSGNGTVFSFNADGTGFTVLHTFTNLAGGFGHNAAGGLVLSGNTLYGATELGGSNSQGSVFSLDVSSSNFTALHSFNGAADGSTTPLGFLLFSNNTLYGTTSTGSFDRGAVFSMNADGSGFTLIHNFAGTLSGTYPNGADAQGGLVLCGNTLYGTTQNGGINNNGIVFSVNTDSSSFTVLHYFTGGSDGAHPANGPLVLDGNRLYGATTSGGAGGNGTVFSLAIVPTITRLTLAGTDAVLDGVNGMAGRSYIVLSSGEVGLPLNQWTPVATNVLASGGNFTITAPNAVTPGATQQFYALQVQ